MHELLRSVLLALFSLVTTIKPQILTVPAYDGEWPTLGWAVIDWMEHNLVHGPGDIKGEPLRLDDEKIGFILRFYEIFPQGHEFEGRRRFDRACISAPKGSAKTEGGAIVVAAELSPDAPVRFDGWNADGTPKGRPVKDPFIPLVAYTEEQSDELAYGALRVILLNSRIADQFDIGLERITRKDGDGKAVSLASSPGARDGARTTFQLFDETHHFTTPELLKAHETMLANIPKRAARSEPWSLEITTAFDPSQNSVARKTYNYARSIHEGRQRNSRLFYFHRQAPDDVDWSDPEQRVAAIIAARGPFVSAWAGKAGIAAIASQWDDPEKDRDFLARVWGNQIRHSSARAFDLKAWHRRRRPDNYKIPAGARITLGFDGAQTDDSTSLVATELTTGFQELLGLWERPADVLEWHINESEVDAAVSDAFTRFDVLRMYADPWYWQTWLATWASRYTDKRVIEFHTNKWRRMADAVRAYTEAMADPSDGDAAASHRLSHGGDERFARHIGNSFKKLLELRDEKGARLWVIQKERSDSPFKIDAAMGGILSWQARLDAMADGDTKKKGDVFNQRAARGDERIIRCV